MFSLLIFSTSECQCKYIFWQTSVQLLKYQIILIELQQKQQKKQRISALGLLITFVAGKKNYEYALSFQSYCKIHGKMFAITFVFSLIIVFDAKMIDVIV